MARAWRIDVKNKAISSSEKRFMYFPYEYVGGGQENASA